MGSLSHTGHWTFKSCHRASEKAAGRQRLPPALQTEAQWHSKWWVEGGIHKVLEWSVSTEVVIGHEAGQEDRGRA